MTFIKQAHAHALERGIIIADTKLEFGLDPTSSPPNQIVLVDEVLTPDSSRFWPADGYAVGRGQKSYDKVIRHPRSLMVARALLRFLFSSTAIPP